MLLRSRYRAQRRTLGRAFSIALLAVALVGAQIGGQAHRVEHAPGSDEHPANWRALLQKYDHGSDDHSHDAHAAHDDGGEHAPEHDCAAYDAATLGDGPPVMQSERAAAPSTHSTLTARRNAVVDNSPHLPFRSRAPPRA